MEELIKKISIVGGKLSVKKNGENPFYKSKYITLDEIVGKLQPLLDEEGLIVYNYNLKDGGVRTIVTDGINSVSSDFVIGDIKDPQQLGKVLTYGRRYNLVSIFNILADEDDDAQSFYDDKGNNKKYDKKVFGMREFKNLEAKKNEYTYEEAMNMIRKNYSIDLEMDGKVMDLYGVEGGDLFN